MPSLEFMLSVHRFDDTKGCCAEHEDLTQQFSASELQAIRATTAATLRKAEEQLVAAGKWSYHLFQSIPTVAGSCNASQCNATECMAKVLEGAQLGASHIPGVMTTSDHHSDRQQEWDIKRDLAAFLIGRGNYSWIGEGWMATRPPIFYPEWELDYGTPLESMSQSANTFTRRFSMVDVSLDCSTGETKFAWKANPALESSV